MNKTKKTKKAEDKKLTQRKEHESTINSTVHYNAQRKEATIHQVTTMQATSKNVLFPGHNYLLTTSTDDPTLWLSPERWE